MFITLEGPDGSGKSTQVAPLVEFLRQQGYSVLPTREPGGTFISDQVRNVLLNRPENSAMHPRTEILLFLASRAQLVEERIRPALLEGTIVLCDRYADSTLAYQGYGHGVDLDTLRSLLAFATGGLQPDLTILLDVSPEEGLRRRKKGGGNGTGWMHLHWHFTNASARGTWKWRINNPGAGILWMHTSHRTWYNQKSGRWF